MPENEPLIVLEMAGERPRGYPLRYLMWHEIVNDRIGNMAVAITFCPLCNSALSFDRRVGGQVLEFGVTGELRHSDMVMYDRQTQSWWQQAQGFGLVGAMAGVQLSLFPVGWRALHYSSRATPMVWLCRNPIMRANMDATPM